MLFLGEAPLVVRESDSADLKVTVQQFDLSKRKVEKFLDDANDFAVSCDGEKMLFREGRTVDDRRYRGAADAARSRSRAKAR